MQCALCVWQAALVVGAVVRRCLFQKRQVQGGATVAAVEHYCELDALLVFRDQSI